jgi:hypothetical protein
MAYDDADFLIRRESHHTTVAGATTEGAKFRSFQAMRLKAVHAAVITAGTNAGHGYDVYHGTTSIGTISLGTGAANTVAHSATLNESVATMEQISVKSLVDATGVASIVYEFEILPSAVQTA